MRAEQSNECANRARSGAICALRQCASGGKYRTAREQSRGIDEWEMYLTTRGAHEEKYEVIPFPCDPIGLFWENAQITRRVVAKRGAGGTGVWRQHELFVAGMRSVSPVNASWALVLVRKRTP